MFFNDLLISVRLGVTYLVELKSNSTSEKSEVCKHLLQNSTHRVDFNTSTILGRENDTARLLILILESLFIQEQTPDLYNDFQSSPLMIFNTVKFLVHFTYITSQLSYFFVAM